MMHGHTYIKFVLLNFLLISKEPRCRSRSVTGLRTEGARKHVSIPGRGYRYFSFWKRQADTKAQLTYSMGSVNTFQGKKWTEREIDDLPLSNAEVRNIGWCVWNYLNFQNTLQNENQIRCYNLHNVLSLPHWKPDKTGRPWQRNR